MYVLFCTYHKVWCFVFTCWYPGAADLHTGKFSASTHTNREGERKTLYIHDRNNCVVKLRINILHIPIATYVTNTCDK
jgi:hypothetical protein